MIHADHILAESPKCSNCGVAIVALSASEALTGHRAQWVHQYGDSGTRYVDCELTGDDRYLPFSVASHPTGEHAQDAVEVVE